MSNASDASLFQKECEKIIRNISKQDFEQFQDAKDEESRISILHKYVKDIVIPQSSNGKDYKTAETKKNVGNKCFLQKDYDNAIKAYNEGIVKCPQDTDASKELLAILIANRSAVFYDLQQYKRVFDDIDYVLEVGFYPKHLRHKIWFRKAKCYESLQNNKLANEAYEETIKCLKYCNLDENSVSKRIEEIDKNRKNCNSELKPRQDVASYTPTEIFHGSKEYVSATNKIRFDQDMVQGRYARAVENIECGTIIVEENPHCAVLSADNFLTNCQHCMLSTNQIFACPTCAYVIFCCSNCERQANKSYHKYECAFLQTLAHTGASINCFMALRIITQKSINYFKEKNKRLRGYLKDNCKKMPIKKNPYTPDDYETVFFLCRNEYLRKIDELAHYSCMALYFLNLLKFSNYFGQTSNDTLTEDERFMAALILRHLQILQFNAHEISELRNVDGNIDDFESLYKSEFIGGGLYPTASLFNHSCDPSIVRYNIGSKMVVRVIKTIKADEIIYENYGPMYTTMKKVFRQQFLNDRYWFECLCTPCTEMWPMLDEMMENELRLPCSVKNCPFVFVIKKDNCFPFFECDFCGAQTSIIPFLKGLMNLEKILPEAEEYYLSSDYENALKKYTEGLNILYKFSKPPSPDIIKIQQRMQTCMIHFGNKSIKYLAKAKLIK